MKNNFKLLLGGLSMALVTTLGYQQFSKKNDALNLKSQRETYANFLKNSPYKETLKWDKKKRKQYGLPPNRYFEQMWELSINPSTGKLEEEGLNKLRNELIQNRQSQRSPGENGNSWEERGPNNVGGRTRVIMFDPNDATNNKVYAGGVSGGLWVNNDISNANSQWQRVQNVPGNLSVTSITVDPRNSNTWYVGTGEQYTAGDVVGNGVYRTVDGGTTWTALNIPAAGGGDITFNASNLFVSGIHYVNDVLAWDNGTSTELFVAVGAHVYGDASSPANWLGLQSAGLYRSTDNGSTWNRIESANMLHERDGNSYYNIPNDLEVGADNRLWMGMINSALGQGGGKVYGSTNGATWTEVAASPLTNSNRVEIEPSATDGNKIYVLAQGTTTANPVHIYKTTNGFSSVTSVNLPNDADTGIAANDFCRGQAFYDLVIEADPSNDNVVYVGGIDLFKTTNGGSSWSQLSHWYGGFGVSNNVHADQHSIAFANNSSSKMLFGNDGGVYYSGNAGSTISVRNKGYNVTQFVKAGIGPDGAGDTAGIFSAGAQDNGTQAFRNATAGINSSTELSDGDGFYTFVDKGGDYMIATYVNNVIYRFSLPWNGQGRRQGGATTLSSDQSTGDFVNQMGYDSDANRLLSNKSTSSSNAIKSINVASNSNGTLTNALLDAKPVAFTASSFTNGRWFVGLANGKLVKLSNVTNSSATWTSINTPFVGAVSAVRLGATENDIFVTIHNYGVTSVWATSDGGANWTSKEGNLPNIPVRDILQNPLDRNEAILATQLGVWATKNFNATNPTWSQAYNGMSDVSVTSFDYWDISGDDTNNKIIASTYGRGVFTGVFTENTVVDTEAPSVPASLAVSNVTETTLTLNWNASTDNVAVTEYDVYQGATKLGSATNTTYNVTGLTAATAYTFTVKAKDAAGNESAASSAVNATTTAPDTAAPTTPIGLLASNVTATTLTLNWSASTDNVAVTEYDVYQGATKLGSATSTTYNVTGLTAATAYTFTVKAKDAAGNESAASTPVNVTTAAVAITYCTSKGASVSDEYIQRVQLGSIDNSSDGGNGYSDHTSVSTNLTKGESNTITITPKWNGTVYNEGYGVWIDYNKDGDFSDAGETVFTKSISKTTPINGSFTVPASATEGATRMRVILKYNATPTACEASFQYGEVEDYTVNIINAAPDTEAPTAPASLTTASVEETTLTLNWNAATDNVAVTGYDVYQGATNIGATTSATTFNVTGLTSGTAYTFTVKAKDEVGNVSAASNAVNVTTKSPDTEAPTAPATLTASNITQTTLTLNWSAATDNKAVTGYDVYQGATKLATVTATTYNVTGLSAATSYIFSVRAKDAAGNVSTVKSANATTLANVLSYCNSQGNRSSYEWIDNVELGGMTNATGDNGGYEDFTSKVATLAQGSSNSMIVSAGFRSTAYTEHWAVWIDFNQNGTFDSSEKVVSGSSSSANNLTATVAVPSGATLGQTRMRVSMKYNSAQTACESFNDGEVEDYTVNIVVPSAIINTGAVASSNADVLGNEKSMNLMTYPNPAKDFVQVKLNSKTANMTYKITNSIGRVVLNGHLNTSNLDVSNLSSGMYILEVNDGQKSLTTKLIKK